MVTPKTSPQWLCCLALLVLLLTGCEHKPLCYDHPHGQAVRVVFNWSRLRQMPGAMRLFFYPLGRQRTEPYVYDVGADRLLPGIAVELPAGKYRVLSFNIDTENVFVRNEQQFADIELYTAQRSLTLTAKRDGQTVTRSIPLVDTPEWMCRASLAEVQVQSATANAEQLIELTPRPAVSRLLYQIRGIRNIDRARSIIGTLSGVAGSLFAGSGMFPEKSSTVHFEASVKGGVVVGEFNLFGINLTAVPREKNLFTLYFRTAAGISHLTFDITDKMRIVEEDNQYVINAYIDIETDMELPHPIGGEGGMQVDVEQWEEVNIDIDI